MPKLGLLSDSHGRASTTQRAVDLLVERGVDRLIHLGDVGSMEVVDALVVDRPDGEQVPAHLVFGNVDWDIEPMTRYARRLGVSVDHPIGRIDLPGGQVLAFTHGHDTAAMSHALAEGVDYLCHGHSHVAIDQPQGATRVINPGALFRAQRYTVAVLDTDAQTVEFLTVEARSVGV